MRVVIKRKGEILQQMRVSHITGTSEEAPHFLADHLTLFQPVGGDYAYHITNGPSRFLDLPPPLSYINTCTVGNFRFLMHGHKKVLLH